MIEFVPMAPVAPSLAGVEPALSIAVVVVVVVAVVVAVVVSRLLVPVLPQGEELAAMDLLVMEFVPMAPVAPSSAGVEPVLSIAVVVVVAVAVSRPLVPVPVLPQVEEPAATDLLVTEFVPTALVVPSLVGAEPALNIAVVDNCNNFYHTHKTS